jgi:hypothetical protein
MTDDGPIFYEKLSSREYTTIERFRRASLKVFAGALGPPLSFVWSSLPKHLVFMNKDGNLSNDFFSEPKSFGVDSENFQITSSSGNTLGLWAVKSESSIGSILFCHGSGGNRATPSHRLAVLKNLSALNFNIVAFGKFYCSFSLLDLCFNRLFWIWRFVWNAELRQCCRRYCFCV